MRHIGEWFNKDIASLHDIVCPEWNDTKTGHVETTVNVSIGTHYPWKISFHG